MNRRQFLGRTVIAAGAIPLLSGGDHARATSPHESPAVGFRPLSHGLVDPPLNTLNGFAVQETAGGSAVIEIRHGSARGPIMFAVSLAPRESRSEGPWSRGLAAPNGVYVNVASGTVAGAIFGD